ncbi:MAG: hypothetical protein GDA53_02540 [Rhodobacteraceae bacterium]|nr:hypothetical protein [Paracoccaceae bacterium]
MAVTALDQFERLESIGLWKESADAQRREVIVSFGAASLVLSDINGKPLAHWSFAAVRTRNAGHMPTLYSPDWGSGEILEIEDETMVDAIAYVRAIIRRRGPHPGCLRLVTAVALVTLIVGLVVFWLPGVSADYATRIMPTAKAEEIGEETLTQVARLTGQPCAAPNATDALHRFERWLMPEGGHIHIIDLGARYSAHLPNNQVILNRILVEEFPGPEVAAGFVLLERVRMAEADPMHGLFRHSGTGDTLRFLANGQLSPNAVAAYARTRLTASPNQPEDAVLAAEFARTGLIIAPFASTLDPNGTSVAGLLALDPGTAGYRPGIDDADWISLQTICGEG